MGKNCTSYITFVKKKMQYFVSRHEHQDSTSIANEYVLVFWSLRFQAKMESQEVNLLDRNLFDLTKLVSTRKQNSIS